MADSSAPCDLHRHRIRVVQVQPSPQASPLAGTLEDLEGELQVATSAGLVGFHLALDDDSLILAPRHRFEVGGGLHLIGIKAT
jgi:hypothetical protein